MMRGLLIVCTVLALGACNTQDAVEQNREASGMARELATALEEDKSAAGTMAMSGINLRMYELDATLGALQKPTLWVHAESGQLESGDSVWSLQGADAVIYRDEQENLHLAAKMGWFDQENNLARLTDGVQVKAGTLNFEMGAIEWDNAEQRAQSEGPVKMTDGGTTLDATTLTLSPDEGTLTLGNVSGRLVLGGPTS